VTTFLDIREWKEGGEAWKYDGQIKQMGKE
jgi:hypothetical protein